MNALHRTIASHGEVERLKHYAKASVPLEPDDVVLTDDVAKRIGPSLHHAIKELDFRDEFHPSLTRIPTRFAKMRAFLHSREDEDGWTGHDTFFSIELFKLLILYGEMETLQKICGHPGAKWIEVWEKHRDADGDPNTCGWSYVPRLALKAYLYLNLLLCYPQLWDYGSGRSAESDYRNTKCYQRMLRECTRSDLSTNIAALPHRQFFGIPENQFSRYPCPREGGKHRHLFHEHYGRDGYPYGIVPFDDFLEFEAKLEYQPTISDVSHVRWCLCKLGLPTEMAIEIMDFAGYVPKRRLERAHDPLHASNREELSKYLNYCWNILVRCDIVGKWLGDEIPWDRLIAETLIQFFGQGWGRKFYEQSYDDEDRGFRGHENIIYTFS